MCFIFRTFSYINEKIRLEKYAFGRMSPILDLKILILIEDDDPKTSGYILIFNTGFYGVPVN